MTSVDSNLNFLCGRPHGAGPPSPVHMRPPEPDPSPLRVVVINGWPLTPLSISRFSMSGMPTCTHSHWIGSLDTSSHATKGKKCVNGTGSLITPNCSKSVNHGVTCTSIFLVLRSFTVENQF